MLEGGIKNNKINTDNSSHKGLSLSSKSSMGIHHHHVAKASSKAFL